MILSDINFENYINVNKDRRGLRQIITSLSLVVILAVFWSLKLTGIGIAGEAFCGKTEHIHNEACMGGSATCSQEEHIHNKTCYSNITADLESIDDWNLNLADMTRGPTVRENMVLVAKSQLGRQESTLNFQVDALGVRRGITRYGQWYGNPYGDWSAMFVGFCLHYAGAGSAPVSAGTETLRLQWQAAGLYEDAQQGVPAVGNLLFLKEPEASGATAVGIITDYNDTTITVIQGDVDNTVAETQYLRGDTAILGYGLVPEKDSIIVVSDAVIMAQSCTIWLDGTDGGLGHLSGSPNTAYTSEVGSIIRLPEEWTSPSKYSYKLRGWYDVSHSRYYPAGAEMEVKGNTVLYADWVASTYDVGIFNAQLADTVSTNAFITTHMFDYNYLFNIQSSNAQVTVSGSSHTEKWSMVTSGNVKYNSTGTADFIFTDNDSEGKLNMPSSRSDRNRYHSATTVTSGIYSAALGEILFSPTNGFNPATGTGILGKTYLGTGDHLFQIMDNPSDEHYGYYYYDSKRNAASYNQSNGRFYVYDYLAATSDSIGGANSDFLPLNSPYANTNGKNVGTYTYDGVDGEYVGVNHYRYDSKYDSGSHNSVNNVYTDYAYGMRMDIKFYLPNDPGTGGNKDMFGNDMQFQFSGDDDLWVLVDGQVVLDIGGIHQIVSGVIDFSTGEVVVNGKNQTSLMDLGIEAGDYTLTVLYLERGSSMSNCSIYFNLAPRFGLEMQKEDVLTQELLDGAEFTVYEDYECTIPAELWDSEEAYNRDLADGILNEGKSTFSVANGIAKIWGFGSGNTYYIKETGPPDKDGYGTPSGVIRLTIEKDGYSTYNIEVIPDADGNQPSNGFTIHGVNINEATKVVSLVVTNAPQTVIETTTVQVIKKWEDKADHSKDSIRAYLTVTDADGNVRRIREVVLSNENEWMYMWTNLPKYDYGTMTKVQYGIEESYESGYYSTVRKITEIVLTKIEWGEVTELIDKDTYVLKTAKGCLSTESASSSNIKLTWVDEETAKTSDLAKWTISKNGEKVVFVNQAGQTLVFNNGNSNNNRYFYATTGNSVTSSLGFTETNGIFTFYYLRNNTPYYISNSNISSGRLPSTSSSGSALKFTLLKAVEESSIHPVNDWAYQITNTPLPSNNETFLAVKKQWNIPAGFNETFYQEFVVTVRLLANGVNTGRTLTLSLKNNWEGVFQGLPYKNEAGEVISYTVEENWQRENWSTAYGSIEATAGSPPTYSTVIINTYHQGGPALPATGSAARRLYVICGASMMIGSLLIGIGSRRKRERRTE